MSNRVYDQGKAKLGNSMKNKVSFATKLCHTANEFYVLKYKNVPDNYYNN